MTAKLKTSLFLCFFGIFLLFSQEKEYTISINNHTIVTQNDFKKKLQKIKSYRKANYKQQQPYVLLQFVKTPTSKEIISLKKEGVFIKSHFAKTTYFAKISDKFHISKRSNKNIRTILSIEPEYKLTPALKGTIPSYAIEGNDVKVIITCFDINKKTIQKDMSFYGVTYYRISKDFNQVIAKINLNTLKKIASLAWVQNIELTPPPSSVKNAYALSSHRVNALQTAISDFGYNLTGKGVKIGLWDANVQKHVDCSGRLVNREYEIESSHGSHVFGTMAGAGIIDPKAKGMAPEAKVFTWNFNVSSNQLYVYEERLKCANEDGIELTQNSYGDYVRTPISPYRYNAEDRGDDAVTEKKPYLLNIYANGNDQAFNATNGGFDTSSKNSKNSLHVGANDRNETMSNYSSFGPTADGRIIPQVSAIGSEVYSMIYGNGYATMSGTSMATPGVSGMVALLYERYKFNNNGEKPLASLIKGIVSNTARDMGNKGPDYKYGFGNVNGLRAVKVIDNNQFFINSIANNQTQEKTITIPQGVKELKVMLCYSDVPGVAGSSKILVNDLDLKVLKDGVTYLPWILNPAKPSDQATRGEDHLNNMEQVTIENPAAGTYKILIKGSEIPLNKQEYSVTYDILTPELNLTYPIGREHLTPKDIEYIRWDYIGDDKNFTLEYSTDNGKSYSTIVENLPANVRNYKWIVPDTSSKSVKIRVIAGSSVSSSRESFHIMNRPNNLKSTDANSCGITSFTMNWDKIANAKYEVLKLKNEKEFVKIAETTTNTYSFTNTKSGANNWYTIRAIDLTTGAISERAIAIKLNPRTSPILTPANLPYFEDFESLQINNFSFFAKDKETGYAGLGYYDTTLKNAAIMGGHGQAQKIPWKKSEIAGHGFATITNAFIDNPSYIKQMKYCGVDATQLSGEKITLNFDLKYTCPTGSNNKIFFRVLVNGKELISTNKKRYYHGINGSYKPFYDLSAYAGTVFDLTFEAVIDDKVENKATGQSIILAIDNIKIAKAKNDVATIYGYTPVKIATAKDKEVPITIRIQNFSSNIITDIPVTYKINGGEEVKEIITKNIYPFNSYNYTFKTKADFSKQKSYDVQLSVKYPNDEKLTNDTYKLNQILNLGDDIVLGQSPPTAGNPLHTYTVCNTTFTDDGTRFGNYKNLFLGFVPKVAIFKPTEAGKKIKIDFSEFDLEKGADYLRVYNGPSISSPLLISLTGSEIPSSITSTAAGGELTFQFVPDPSVTRKGWIANIQCVSLDKKEEAEIVRITKPEVINKKTATTVVKIIVKNLGEKPRTNLPVFYQVNDGIKVEEIIKETIAPLEEKEYAFKTTTDMSKKEGDFKYVITAGINEKDIMSENNTTKITVYNKYKLPGNNNTDGYGITSLSWGDFTNKSGVSGYSNFKSKIIPVQKETQYIPVIKLAKPEVPMSKFFNNRMSGIFTVMVIDLNNDGDFSDEFYKGDFWVNTEVGEPKYSSTKTTHYLKKAVGDDSGVTIPAEISNGKHLVRFIHMFRSKYENYNILLGPTKDGLNTSRTDFEIEEYTLDIQDKPTFDASITNINVTPKKQHKSSIAVDVMNNSKVPIVNFDIAYKIDSGSEIIQKVTEEIPVGEKRTIVFDVKAALQTEKNYIITAFTKLLNDKNTANDVKTKHINHTAEYSKNIVGVFNGMDSYIAPETASTLNLINNYTFEAWINQTEKATNIKGGGLPRIIDKNTVKVFINNSYSKSYKNNSFVFYFMTDKGEYILNTNENTVPLNTWQHIAFSVSDSNKYELYINGKSVPFNVVTVEGSTTIPGSAISNVSDILYIGNQKGEDRGFEGYIDEIRIWKGVRSPQEIANNMNKDFKGGNSKLLAYYPIKGSNGKYIYDYSTADNTAIIHNSDVVGVGHGKFRKVPTLLKNIRAINQIDNKYDKQTKTYSIYLSETSSASNVVLDYDLQMQSIVKINNIIQENKKTSNDFTNPVTITVKGEGFNKNITETYTLKVFAGLKAEATLLSYNFLVADNNQLSEDVNTSIDGVSVEGKTNADKNNLIASFKVSPKATLYIDNKKQENYKTQPLNYNKKVIITVVSENKLNKTYYEVELKNKSGARKENNFTVKIYPNPVINGKLNVESNLLGEKTIVIYSLSGNQLLYFVSSTNEIDLSKLNEGTYLLKIIQNKHIKNKIIVVKRK